MLYLKSFFANAIIVLLFGSPFSDFAKANPVFGYEVETDVVFGNGRVIVDGRETERDLMLDVYTPSDSQDDAARPAVILVHGGAFHRGGRRQAPFREAGAVHSRMEDYARLLTPLGYVCFVIEYRLALELPQTEMQPGTAHLLPLDAVVESSALARTNHARQEMGLPALADDERIVLWDAAMAGAEDTAKAVAYVRAHADQYGIDPTKIAVGGHSAGGGNAMNVAIGLNVPVAAAFPLSPPASMFDLAEVMKHHEPPPILMAISQNDVALTLETAPETIATMRAAGADAEFIWVPGFAHFYPTGAITLGDDGRRMSLGERVIEFLDKHLK